MEQPTKNDARVLFVAFLVATLSCVGAYFLNAYLIGHFHRELFNAEYNLTLTTYDGKPARLYDYRTKTIVAYAWASWCPYCGAEIENLAKLKATYGDRIQIIAINRAEPAAVAKAYTDQLTNVNGVQFLLDPKDQFFKTVGGYAMPETVFIRPGGDVTFHQRGPMQFDEVSAQLRNLLGR